MAVALHPRRGVKPFETRFQELKRYVAFTDDDARLLAALRPHAEPYFERIGAGGLRPDPLRARGGAHRGSFKTRKHLAWLQPSLDLWMTRLLSGVYSGQGAKIGRLCVKMKLPQRYIFTAMALIRVALAEIADSAFGSEARPTREALTRLLDLELAIALEAYGEESPARTRRAKAQKDQTLTLAEHRYVNAVWSWRRVLIVGLDAHAVGVRLFNREAERASGFGNVSTSLEKVVVEAV